MENIMKIVKSLEESGLLVKRINENKIKRGGFIPMLLVTLAASLLRKGLIIEGEGVIRAGQGKS